MDRWVSMLTLLGLVQRARNDLPDVGGDSRVAALTLLFDAIIMVQSQPNLDKIQDKKYNLY